MSKMLVEFAIRILLLVISVEASGDYFVCNFKGHSCGFTSLTEWTRSQGTVGYIECEKRFPEGRCGDIESQKLPSLSDGKGCLSVTFTTLTIPIRVYLEMFNSTSSVMVGMINSNINASEEETHTFKLSYTSYNQVRLYVYVTKFDTNRRYTWFRFLRLEFFRCPPDTTAAMTQAGNTTTTTTPEMTTTTPEMTTTTPEMTTTTPKMTTTTPEMTTTTPEMTTTTPVRRRPTSCYFNASDICFQYMDVPKSHRDAQDSCRAQGGKLPEMRGEAIMNGLMNEVKAKGRKMWIGANNLNNESEFVWESDNEKMSIPETWWIRGEPNNWLGKENCVMMKPPSGKLNDAFCGKKLAYFCEF